MYSVLLCRWLPQINHKISITRPFKNQIANETQKPKILFLRRTKLQVAWLLAACSLIWPCSAILRVHSMHAYSILLQRIASTKRLLFWGNQKSRARGGRRTLRPKWEEVAHLFSFGLVTQLRCSKLGYTISHMGPLWTHMFHFSDVSFLTTSFQLLSNIKVFQLIGQIVKGRLFFYKLSWYQMCPKRTSVVQSLELNFFFRCLHDNPSGQKIPPAMYCYTTRSERELFWGGRQKRWSFSSRWVYNVKASLRAPHISPAAAPSACRGRPVCPRGLGLANYMTARQANP